MLLNESNNIPFPFLFLLVLPEGQDMQMWMVYNLIYIELSASGEIKYSFVLSMKIISRLMHCFYKHMDTKGDAG